MKIVFDILGSPANSGGMRLHGTEIIRTWREEFPEDELLVVGGEWARQDFEPLGVTVRVVDNERVVGRALGQLFVTPGIAARTKADHVISLSPLVSPLIPSKRSSCFQHDWRHKKNPEEFPLMQRAYRTLWQVSASRAGMNFCISEKAVAETQEYARHPRTLLVENGRDHARGWEPAPSQPETPQIVTFGHHNNKRPELVLRGVAHAGDRLADYRLTILGARGAYAETLRGLASELGLESRVDLPGFVSDEEYQRTISTASVIVLASSDEGFGLPVAEAQYLGIPTVITSDSGIADLFADFVLVAPPTAEGMGDVLHDAAVGPRPAAGIAENETWRNSVTLVRSDLVKRSGTSARRAHR